VTTTAGKADEPPAVSRRTPPKRKARELAKHLRGERPDYAYLKEVFRHLRAELDIEVVTAPVRLPYVPTEQEIRRYYQTVWVCPERRGRLDVVELLDSVLCGRWR